MGTWLKQKVHEGLPAKSRDSRTSGGGYIPVLTVAVFRDTYTLTSTFYDKFDFSSVLSICSMILFLFLSHTDEFIAESEKYSDN